RALARRPSGAGSEEFDALLLTHLDAPARHFDYGVCTPVGVFVNGHAELGTVHDDQGVRRADPKLTLRTELGDLHPNRPECQLDAFDATRSFAAREPELTRTSHGDLRAERRLQLHRGAGFGLDLGPGHEGTLHCQRRR